MHILIYITSEEGCGKGFPQHQRTWKILRCINDCLFSPVKNQTEISSRTHREWDRAGRSDGFQHHTQSAIFYYWMWICNTMTFFSSVMRPCSPYPHSANKKNKQREKKDTSRNRHTSQLVSFFYQQNISVVFVEQLLRNPERASSLWGLDWDCFCRHTVMYAQLRTTQRINKECLCIHSPRLQQHRAPSFTQTALAAR